MLAKKSALKIFGAFSLMLAIFFYGCGGGGGSSNGDTGAVQGSGLLTMAVNPPTVESSPEADDRVTVSFNLSDYNEGLPAFPVSITGYKISFKRLDCNNCPAPSSFTIGSGITVQSGESTEEEITLISEQMKTRLPIAALRNDVLNPISNQAFLSAGTGDVSDQTLTEIIGASRTETIQNFGDLSEKLVANGDGSTVNYSFYLDNPPVLSGSFSLLSDAGGFGTGSTVIQTIGSGGNSHYTFTLANTPVTPSSVNILIYNSKVSTALGSGDDVTTTFTGTLGSTPAIAKSIEIYAGDVLVGYDDGNGNLLGPGVVSGTVNYTSGAISVTLAVAPASGDAVYVTYLDTLTSLVATDDGAGSLVGVNGYNVSGFISYSDGGLDVSFPVTPSASATIAVQYRFTQTDGNTGELTVIATDDGDGVISGNGVSGSMVYDTGYVAISFTTAPSDGTNIYASYYTGSGTISSPEIEFTLTKTPIPGSVVILDNNDNILATDDGNGNISGDNANGTIDYSGRSGLVTLLSIEGISSVRVLYHYQTMSVLSLHPIVEGSIQVVIGNQTCSAVSGILSYPCAGTIDMQSGQINNLMFYNTSAVTDNISVTYSVPNNVFVGGDRNLAVGDGVSTEFILSLRYPPIEPPNGDYALTIVTGDGQIAVDKGGTLEGDVCRDKRSYIDRSSGTAYVCFSSPPSAGAEIFAFYRTTSMKLQATITAEGYEVGGNNISVSRKVTVSLN